MSDRILIETSDPDERTDAARRSWRGVALATVAIAIVGWSLASTTNSSEAPEPDPTLLTEPFSPPDGAWSEIEFSGEGAFTTVLETDEGLFAAGSGRKVDSTPFVWASPDGITWEETSGPWQPGDIIVALGKGPAGFLAGGYQIGRAFRGGLTDSLPKIWSSTDGSSWDLEPTTGLPSDAVITGMTAVAGEVVAIGWQGPAALEPLAAPVQEASPRVWSSSDGSDWTDVTPDGEATWFADVAITPTGLAVVGGADDRGPAIWMLEQGTWTHLPNPQADAETVSALTWVDDAIIALTRSITDPEALVSAWSIGPDRTWTPTLTGIERPGTSGWVEAVDGSLFAASGFSRSVISTGPEVFVSRSGEEWIGVEVTAGVTPWPPPRITAVIDFRGELYAFGSRGPSPAAWQLADDPEDSTGP